MNLGVVPSIPGIRPSCPHPVNDEMEPELSLRRPDGSPALYAAAGHAARNARREMGRVRGGVREAWTQGSTGKERK